MLVPLGVIVRECASGWRGKRPSQRPQQREVLDSLENTAKRPGEAGWKARKVLNMFQSSATIIGAHIANELEWSRPALRGSQPVATGKAVHGHRHADCGQDRPDLYQRCLIRGRVPSHLRKSRGERWQTETKAAGTHRQQDRQVH